LNIFLFLAHRPEPGDEPLAGRDAPLVRRLARAGRAVRPGRDVGVRHGGQVAHEDQQRAPRGALQPRHRPDRYGYRVRYGHQRF